MEEVIGMSRREINRHHVIRNVFEGKATQALYVDRDSIYTINWAAKHESLECDESTTTQFTRAMGELGIDVITANSPQAKGRVERGFGTHQDRLVKELRLRGISTMAAANLYLWEHYLPQHNTRYAVDPAANTDVHRPLLATHRLEQILSLRTQRTVMNDYALSYEGKFLQVLEHQLVRVDPGDKVEVEIRLDGSRHVRFKGGYLNYKGIEKRPYRPHLHARRNLKSGENHPLGLEKTPLIFSRRRPRGAAGRNNEHETGGRARGRSPATGAVRALAREQGSGTGTDSPEALGSRRRALPNPRRQSGVEVAAAAPHDFEKAAG